MSPPSTHLPGAATSFVGRAADLSALSERLSLGRLVTITGPGGIGKTRLALRFAQDRIAALAERGGAVWFCDLSHAHDVADIVSAVVSALALEIESDGSETGSSEAVGRAIGRLGHVLLVLDNFDRLLPHAWTTVGRWLRLAPSARFLVTSRASLELAGESVWSLAPLPFDEAVALFAQRADQVQPSFELAKERATVGSIVEAIDRLPLAIELAATRLSVVSAGQLRDRLARPLEVLAGRREDGRQTSLRRTILDSVEVLGADERALFAGCAVLRNGFSLETVEAVLGDLVAPRDAILDLLAALVRASLLRMDVAPGEIARYSFLETIRDVAEELPHGHVAALRARTATYHADRARVLRRREREEPRDPRDVDQLLSAQEIAASLARESGDEARAIEAAEIALALTQVLSARGATRICAAMFDEVDRALAATGSRDARLRAEVCLARGRARRELGETALARDDFARALEAARAADEPGLAAVALTCLGDASDVVGDTRAARERFEEALALLARTPPGPERSRREGEAHLRIGHAYRREGALGRARASIACASERARALGDDVELAAALYEAAVVEMFDGAHDAASAFFDEGLLVAQRSEARVLFGALKTARGCLLQDLGRLDEALAHHAEATRVFHDAGSRYREGSATYYLASTYLERGDPRETRAILRRARACLENVGAARYTVLVEGCEASAAAALGDLEGAARALALADRAAGIVHDEPALLANLSLHRLGLALRNRGWEGGEEVLRQAQQQVQANPSDDARFALRVLRREFAARTGAAATSTRAGEPGEEAREVLVVYAGGRGFRAPGGVPVTLPERSPLRRILEHFAKRRIDAPGEIVTLEDIVQAGWPKEKIGSDAALNRAYVALANLRKLGLRGLLLNGGGGYAISQALIVRIDE